MRYHFLAIILFAWPAISLAEESATTQPATTRPVPATRPAASVNEAIDRGLIFLTKDALAWKADHNCASCHHASLIVWTMHEAKKSGFAVDEPVLAELTQWIANAGDGKFSMTRPAEAPRGFNSKALHFSLGLAAVPNPDATTQEGAKRLLATVKSDQLEDGSWQAWPNTRPPIFGPSHEVVTTHGVLALIFAAESGDDEAKVMRDKGIKWLQETKTDDDPQSIAMRLVIWQKMGRSAEERAPLIQRIKERQNPDGGWSQTTEMPSDAWATGQALYALAYAGIKPDDPAIERGQAFLMKMQRHDGSWLMTSRPAQYTDKVGANNLIPITGAGSAWAVMGLARSHLQAVD